MVVCALSNSVGLIVEVFGLPCPGIERWYRFRTVAAEPGPLHAVGGIKVVARHGLALLRQADIVVLPGWRGVDAIVPVPLRKALIAAHIREARLVSICSGAFVLAACRLLDGRCATTHWRYAEALQKAFPSIDFDPDVLFVDEDNILTSAGSARGHRTRLRFWQLRNHATPLSQDPRGSTVTVPIDVPSRDRRYIAESHQLMVMV